MLIIIRIRYIFKNNEICICREFECLPIYGKDEFAVGEYIPVYGYRVKFTPSRSEFESKRNACNNFTNSV